MKEHLCNKCGCKMEIVGKQGRISRGRWEENSILECPACHNEWFITTVEAPKVPKKLPLLEVLSIPFYMLGHQPATIDETFEWFSDHFKILENIHIEGLLDGIDWDAWMKELIRHLKKIEKGAIKP